MSVTLLRVEAVNLANSVFDTEDLSTRRGGSLMLLRAVEDIEKNYKDDLERISTGASIGLFKVTGKVAPDAVVMKLRKFLTAHPLYRHGTFVIDWVDATGDFRVASESVIAANRWQQMESLSFSGQNLGASADGVCNVDEIRPASTTTTVKGKKGVPVSQSIAQRKTFGVDNKRTFYAKLLDPEGKSQHFRQIEFTMDFDDLANHPHDNFHPKTLEGKIAVFYVDGNKFGGIARDCKDPRELGKWDEYLKGQRKALLARLINRAISQEAKERWQTRNGALRLETLLWGGDELIFAVPGWCGLEVADEFFKHAEDMRYPPEDGKSLTHACGLVFCHHQAPISSISALAKALAEKGKDAAKNANSLHWMVLESFDHAGGNLDAFLARRFPVRQDGASVVAWQTMGLDSDAVAKLNDHLPTLKEKLPRSTIIRIVRMMAEGAHLASGGTSPHPLLKRSYQQIDEAIRTDDSFTELWKALHPLNADWTLDPTLSDLSAWVKLIELWDYCTGEAPAIPRGVATNAANRGAQ